MMNNINPDFIINQIMRSPNLANNVMAQNAVNMYRKGDTKGLNEMMNNLCNEKGVNLNDMTNKVKSMFGIN